jgi:hypothetical protein
MVDKQDIQDKAEERITLARGEVWLLRIAAATGVISMFSHGIDLLHELGIIK